MATIRVFSPSGVKELKCFDTLAQVPYLDEVDPETGFDLDPFEEIAQFESD